jgi:hypothetical protein
MPTRTPQQTHLVNCHPDPEKYVVSSIHARPQPEREKSIFAAPSVEFQRFHIDKDVMRPTQDKVKAIKEAPSSQNKSELQSFLRLLNFYNYFRLDKATTLASPTGPGHSLEWERHS